MARLLSAAALRETVHCAGCGAVDPQDDGDGYTTCCNKRVCNGWGWSVTEGCCHETRDRLAAERHRLTRNANLDRHMADVAAALEAADAKGQHTHAGVRVGVGATNCGPVLAWRYDVEEEGYGAITVVNYKGEELYKLLSDVMLEDIRPCWDRCEHAPAAAPAAAPAPVVEVKEMTIARPAAKTTRAAQGAASAEGWELLYDKPKAGAEVGRRYVGEKAQYALICKAHGHVHALERLSDEGKVRKAGGWCPSC
jgi:hypothetical protein